MADFPLDPQSIYNAQNSQQSLIVISDRAPSSNDIGYSNGTLWLAQLPQSSGVLYYLAGFSSGVPQWEIPVSSGSSIVTRSRNPNSLDTGYSLGQLWLNTTSLYLFYLGSNLPSPTWIKSSGVVQPILDISDGNGNFTRANSSGLITITNARGNTLTFDGSTPEELLVDFDIIANFPGIIQIDGAFLATPQTNSFLIGNGTMNMFGIGLAHTDIAVEIQHGSLYLDDGDINVRGNINSTGITQIAGESFASVDLVSNTTLDNNTQSLVFVDTTGGSFTVTLPAIITAASTEFTITDNGGNCTAAPLTILATAANIVGSGGVPAASITLASDYGSYSLVYSPTASLWIVKAKG